MTTTEINYLANNLFAEIKSAILKNKTDNPNNIKYLACVNVYKTQIPHWVNIHYKDWDGYGMYVKGSWVWGAKSVVIRTKDNNKEWHLSLDDKKAVTKKLIELLKEQKTKRGWSSLKWEIEENQWQGGAGLWFIKNVWLEAEPCKEWASLKNYLVKYCGKEVGDKDIWCVGIGGKRGRVYGEEGDRYYLCNQPHNCTHYLEQLRKTRGTNDKVSAIFKTKDDIDEWELQSSIRNEVEFSGVRSQYLEVTIKTPSGKQKGIVEIGRR